MKSFHNRVITAWAEAGPEGNCPVWYLVRVPLDNGCTGYELKCIQPIDQTNEIGFLYQVSSACHESMTRAVENYLLSKVGNEGG